MRTTRPAAPRRAAASFFAVASFVGAAGAFLAAPATAQEEGAPHTGLIKHAIFTRVFGRPTIPHIMKFVDGSAQPDTRRQSTMPTLNPGAFSAKQTGLPSAKQADIRPAKQMQSVDPWTDSESMTAPVSDAPALDVSQRTFSYHYPWAYGTVAGSYDPAYLANYGSYLGGNSSVGYYGLGPWRFGGYWGGFPYLAAYQPFGYYGNLYGGYRPWGLGRPSALFSLGLWHRQLRHRQLWRANPRLLRRLRLWPLWGIYAGLLLTGNSFSFVIYGSTADAAADANLGILEPL